MINHYEFIDRKPDGTKERKLGAITQLYNKLSAEETNNIRAKLNELVDAANFSSIPLYSVFGLKFKGPGNTNTLIIELGDIAHRYSASGIIENARFNGGDPQDPENYTIIVADFEPMLFISNGISNEFELVPGMKAQSLFLDRGLKYKVLEWGQNDTTVEILGPILIAGRKIYITS